MYLKSINVKCIEIPTKKLFLQINNYVVYGIANEHENSHENIKKNLLKSFQFPKKARKQCFERNRIKTNY